MSKRVRLLAVAIVFAVFVAAPHAAQAYVIPLSVDQMVGMADTIVEVRVSASDARWTRDSVTRARRSIVTDTRMHVIRTLKGQSPADFTFSQPGGRVGIDALVASELPAFEPGERCILFLDENGVIGGLQGRLQVVDGAVPAMDMPLAEAVSRIRVLSAVGSTSDTLDAAVAPVLAADARASVDVLLVPSGDVTVQASTTVFASTFEGGSTAGWTMLGSPTWGATTYRAQAGTYSLYGSSGGVGAVPAPGPCPQTVTAIAGRTTNLSGFNFATLEWDVRPAMSVAGTNWFNVALATSSAGPWCYPNTTFAMGSPGEWQHFSIDLRSVTDYFTSNTYDFTGDSAVYVRLIFSHGVGTSDEGVYVDNVELTADNVVSPTILSISPSSANAGVGDEITISGSAFGATQASGSVTFLRGDAQDGSRVAGSVVSWSDTEIVVEVPRLAESGGVVVNTDTSGASAGYIYKVGFSDSGLRWASPTVTYRINENTSDMVGEGAAIQQAFDTWTDCGSQFSLLYGGTCASTTPPGAIVQDGHSDVYFASSGFPTGVLALNYYWYSGTTKLESDIVFNDGVLWGDGVSGRYDVQTVALHELGHTVGLDDQYGDLDEAMGAGSATSTRRDLSSYDIAGAVYVWGAVAVPDTTPPAAPAVNSSTHPSQSTWYADPDPAFAFSASDPSGIAGYSYVLDASGATTPDQASEGVAGSAGYAGLADGVWYFHVRAVDGAGNWSAASHYAVRIDTSVPLSVIEVQGDTRFDTAVEASKIAFPSGASTVVIATGRNWPDALGGAALAGAVDGPILLSDTNALPGSVVEELGRLGATHALVLGGTGTLGIGVEQDLTQAGLTFERIGGSSRYATAELIAHETIARLGAYDGTALVATGRNFPDALAASPMSAAKGWPVFLADPGASPQALTSRMALQGVTDVIILGGDGAVSAAYHTALDTTFGDVTRLAGEGRYETCAVIAQYAVDYAGLSYDGLAIGVGTMFPDALAGGPLCARNGGVLLLTDTNALVAPTAAALQAHKAEIAEIQFLGGPSAVSLDVRSQVTDLLQ